MSDAAALLAAIRAAPHDDAPRLVYADWLDEHGQPERAEFIRVQCALARRKTLAVQEREAELLAAHHDAFAGPLAAPGLRFRFERGFVVGFGHSGIFWSEDDGRGRWRTRTLLKFVNDGTVGIQTTTLSIEALIQQMVRTGNRDFFGYNESGRYVMDSFGFPSGLQFSVHTIGGSIQFQGFLERAAVRGEVHRVATGRRVQQTFSHFPDPNFESFDES